MAIFRGILKEVKLRGIVFSNAVRVLFCVDRLPAAARKDTPVTRRYNWVREKHLTFGENIL